MKINVDVLCKGCGFKTKVSCKRPDRFFATIHAFVCSSCESRVCARIEIAGNKKDQVLVSSKVTHPSPILTMMREEEENENV